MSLDPKAKIPLSMVAVIAERAYRRGFQQGHNASEANTKLIDLYKWRFDMRTTAALLPQTSMPLSVEIYTSLDRLSVEEGYRIEHFLRKEFEAKYEITT